VFRLLVLVSSCSTMMSAFVLQPFELLLLL